MENPSAFQLQASALKVLTCCRQAKHPQGGIWNSMGCDVLQSSLPWPQAGFSHSENRAQGSGAFCLATKASPIPDCTSRASSGQWTMAAAFLTANRQGSKQKEGKKAPCFLRSLTASKFLLQLVQKELVGSAGPVGVGEGQCWHWGAWPPGHGTPRGSSFQSERATSSRGNFSVFHSFFLLNTLPWMSNPCQPPHKGQSDLGKHWRAPAHMKPII